MRSAFYALLLGSLLPLQAVGAQPVESPTLLNISATGEVARTPDVASLSAGVVSTAATASAALAANSTAMTAMVAAVRKAGVANADIQTSNLSLQPKYRYENNREPVLTGYQASNTVRLKVRKIADTGPLIDAMVAQGANQIDGPSFSLDKPEAALDEARAEAVATARARAALYAKAAGMKVRRIVSITEAGTGGPPEPQPMMRMAAMAEAAPAPPVEAGDVSLSVQLRVSFELE